MRRRAESEEMAAWVWAEAGMGWRVGTPTTVLLIAVPATVPQLSEDT